MISQRVQSLLQSLRIGRHKEFRVDTVPDVMTECARLRLPPPERAALLARRMCEAENPVILPAEEILFTRTLPRVPGYYAPDEAEYRGESMYHYDGQVVNNICADWPLVLEQGLLGRRKVAEVAASSSNPDVAMFGRTAMDTIDAVLELAKRYADTAEKRGLTRAAERLRRVPALPARSYAEALQSLKFCHSALWLAGHHHVGIGRFDQYMFPFAEKDVAEGRASWDEIADLTAEFFISLNKDSDLYPGIQQGDNGQSIMLGGITRTGDPGVNRLTSLALEVACDVQLIDPKLNLRVNSDTPMELLEQAVRLTKLGLGFPQYSNDDVVIPALVRKGYALEDARDYSVAACWEFIIPGKGMDVVNIGALSFPSAADAAIRKGLAAGLSFAEIMQVCRENIDLQVETLLAEKRDQRLLPAPFYSCVMSECLESGRDLSEGAKYNNLGIHGAGSANAADALAAVSQLVYDEKSITPETMLAALDADFVGYETLRNRLLNDAPKVGNNQPEADRLLTELFGFFADAAEKYEKLSDRWDRVRPGTGSAMFYVWLAKGRGDGAMVEPVVGATADGRKKGDFFSSSLAPAPGIKSRGPLSILTTFAKIDYLRACNGGPITLELSDSVFRTSESISKVAELVKIFQRLGCQQLQLNTLNVEHLLDAKAHPENHRNLVVRVWGWSGYFCELSTEYQDQIIGRHMLVLS